MAHRAGGNHEQLVAAVHMAAALQHDGSAGLGNDTASGSGEEDVVKRHPPPLSALPPPRQTGVESYQGMHALWAVRGEVVHAQALRWGGGRTGGSRAASDTVNADCRGRCWLKVDVRAVRLIGFSVPILFFSAGATDMVFFSAHSLSQKMLFRSLRRFCTAHLLEKYRIGRSCNCARKSKILIFKKSGVEFFQGTMIGLLK